MKTIYLNWYGKLIWSGMSSCGLSQLAELAVLDLYSANSLKQ